MSAPSALLRNAKVLAWLEIIVVLLATFAPTAFGQLISTKDKPNPFDPIYQAIVVLAEITLIMYIVWLKDGNLRIFKLGKPIAIPDVALGLFLCFTFFVTNAIIREVIPPNLYAHWNSMSQTAPLQEQVQMRLPLWLVLLSLLAVNSFEEILMRGFLTGRLLQVMSNKWAPIVLSSTIFASWHIYEGPLGIINAFILGVILASVYVYSNRIWPLIIAHFSFDAAVALYYMYYQGRR